MKRLIFTSVFTLFAGNLFAQLTPADTYKTKKGTLTIQPIFHAAIVMTLNKITIYVDPYNDGANAYKGIAAPDLILITDIHPDHLDTATLNALNTEHAIFIVPQAVADILPAKFKQKMKILSNANNLTHDSISIAAVPMYNLPEEQNAMHTKGRGNGYILTMGGKKIYISGDTEDIPEMRNLKNIDIAFLCMNLPYTMDINQAASAALAFKPKIIYPYHYRGKDGFSNVKSFKNLVNKGDFSIDVRLRDWYTNN